MDNAMDAIFLMCHAALERNSFKNDLLRLTANPKTNAAAKLGQNHFWVKLVYRQDINFR
jgi:hypothetical protein